ncbi:MAG: Smr/MutS family protein [Desulfobacterales bacterium]|nr:Smr/MutS family protein [Desulfobacterales bacterium]
MKESKSSGFNTPFANLKSFLKAKSIPLNAFPVEKVLLNKKFKYENDDALFEAAMADVLPINKENIFEFENKNCAGHCSDQIETVEETLTALENLVSYGKGFDVESTSEYIEGTGPDICREVVKRLHHGKFSIQGFIDLHGLTVAEAREVFEDFLKESVTTGKRGVLVVHGRGLSSPNEPVLKTQVYHWLTRGPWRKWIMAFSSARSCDGGAGATYVLLRKQPVTKRRRKKRFFRI